MVGGASALVQDVPPFVIAAGNKAVPHGINVEGLRRRGFSPDAISALRSAYRLLYKNGLSLEEAKVGGYGVMLVRRAASGLDYLRTDAGRNRLIVTLRRAAP